jgi:hypothetical protein
VRVNHQARKPSRKFGSVDFFSIGFSVPAFKVFGLAHVCVGVAAGIGLGALPGGGVAILGIVCCCLVGRPGAARSFAAGGGRRIVRAARRSGLLLCRCACPIGALLSIRARKPSFPCDGSGLADLGCGA